MEIVNQAIEELKIMATASEPLWIRSVETGREILNYDEYVKEFKVNNSSNGRPKRSIEASRETGVVFVDLPRLVQSFMDVVIINLKQQTINAFFFSFLSHFMFLIKILLVKLMFF